ncbi:hypothetical protein [Elioraea rosea]|uniref:hypothetical protein n=1 Tax=Elioraea rosea TaxID=2492390 RepID=UPI00118396EA|nr:hypothetical protein [Elioraea rosea]
MKPEPLQLGQVLYPIHDTTLICAPKGQDRAVLQRVTFTGSGEHVVAKASESVDLAPIVGIQAVRAVSNLATGKQEVVIVRQDDLDVIAHDDAAGLTTTNLRLVPPDFVRIFSIGASSGPGAVPERPGDTVGRATPWYMSGDAVLTIGYDPLAKDKRSLALLVAAGAGFGVQFWDLDAGAKISLVKLPDQVCGSPVAAEVIRSGDASILLVATVEEVDENLKNPFRAHSLKVHAVAWTDLSPDAQAKINEKLEPKQVTTLTLGGVPGPVDPHGTVFKGRWHHESPDHRIIRPPARAQVSATVARLRKGVADQQLVLAWANGVNPYVVVHGGKQPATWSCQVAVVGCGADGRIAVLAGANPDVGFGFAIPGAPIFRVVAADLKQAGVEQLVVGYPAFFGKMESTVALMSFSLDESKGSPFALTCVSRTVVAATAPEAPHGSGRWGECYLYLAAGVFGDYKAVQIISAARDSRESASHSIPIVSGFVPVNPVTGCFPECELPPPKDNRSYNIVLPGGVPVLAQGCQTLATIDWDVTSDPGYSNRSRSLRFFAFPTDLTGKSVVLGAPTLTQVESTRQILAIIQAPPFDAAISDDLPTVSFNTASDQTTGYSVSTSKMWTVSDDTHFSASLGGFSLSQAIHDSHSNGLDDLKDTTVTQSVHFQLHSSKHDWMMVHEIGFDVWRYPVLRSSEKDAVSVDVLVVFPRDSSPRLSLVPCFLPEYGYRPNSEVGMLLSYCEFLPNNKKKMGFDAKNQLFKESGGISVVHEKGGTIETFDASKMNNDTIGKNFSLFNSVSNSASIAIQTELFDFLPASFGLNLTHTETYLDHRVETTHITRNEHFSLSITSGSVIDDIYSFKIVPYIYNHATLGCLMVAWDVILTGDNWRLDSRIDEKRRMFGDPDIRLIRVSPDSQDARAQSRSRSISFSQNNQGSTDIIIELFNNSISAATDVVCEVFLGEPLIQKDRLSPPATLLGKLELGEIGAMQRIETRLDAQRLDPGSIVTVRVWSDDLPVATFGHIYWNMYGFPS